MQKTYLHQRITVEALLEHLPLVAGENWTIDTDGDIRNDNDACPICAVVAELNPSIWYTTDANAALTELLGRPLDIDERHAVTKVICAADRFSPGGSGVYDKGLRERIKSLLDAKVIA